MSRSWYTDGKTNIMVKDNEEIPEGFYKGRVVDKLSDEVKKKANEKRRKTCFDNYGVENPSQSTIIKERVKKTNIERYGVDSYAKLDIAKERTKKTNLKRYGTEYPSQSKEVQDKVRKTNQEKYGVDYTFMSKELMKDAVDKRNKTIKLKYGVDNVSKSQEIKDKKTNSYIKHYGVSHPSKLESIQNKKTEAYNKKYGVGNPAKALEVKEKIKQTNIAKYGVPWTCMRPEAKRGMTNDSIPNKQFAELLEKYNIPYEREFPLGKYVYDFKVDNTLVEIDPYATHNSLWSPFDDSKGKEQDYHRNKSLLAEDNGYHCIHIFDWDNPEKIIKLLLSKRDKLYARKTRVFGISKEETIEFVNENHIQGSCNGQTISLGLKDEYGNIVSMMTFGKPRYNKNYQYELLRYCSSKSVIGGPQKLFKYFIKEHNPESIISYCDRSKFRGDVYTKLGFKLKDRGAISKHWYNPITCKHFTDNLVRQRGFDQLMNASYGKGTSNEELLILHNFLPIYDCGQAVYVWNK